MRTLVVLATICLATFIAQNVSAHSSHGETGVSLNMSKSKLATCDVSDMASKLEELITQGIYTLGNVVISLESSAYETVTCVKGDFCSIWSCIHEVWVDEVTTIQNTVQEYYSTAGDIIQDIIQDLLTCVDL